MPRRKDTAPAPMTEEQRITAYKRSVAAGIERAKQAVRRKAEENRPVHCDEIDFSEHDYDLYRDGAE